VPLQSFDHPPGGPTRRPQAHAKTRCQHDSLDGSRERRCAEITIHAKPCKSGPRRTNGPRSHVEGSDELRTRQGTSIAHPVEHLRNLAAKCVSSSQHSLAAQRHLLRANVGLSSCHLIWIDNQPRHAMCNAGVGKLSSIAQAIRSFFSFQSGRNIRSRLMLFCRAACAHFLVCHFYFYFMDSSATLTKVRIECGGEPKESPALKQGVAAANYQNQMLLKIVYALRITSCLK
jgi:hypothetical protein